MFREGERVLVVLTNDSGFKAQVEWSNDAAVRFKVEKPHEANGLLQELGELAIVTIPWHKIKWIYSL